MPLRIYSITRYQELYNQLLQQHIEEIKALQNLSMIDFGKEVGQDAISFEGFLEKGKQLFTAAGILSHGIPEWEAYKIVSAFDEKWVSKAISYDLFQQLVTDMNDSNKFGIGFDPHLHELGFRMYVGCSDTSFEHKKYGIVIVPSLCNKDSKKTGKEKSAFKSSFFAIDADNTQLSISPDDCSKKIAGHDDKSKVKAVLFILNDLKIFADGIENMPSDPKKAAVELLFGREADDKLTLVLRFRNIKQDGRLGDILESDGSTGLVFNFNKGDLVPPPPEDTALPLDDSSFQ